ncbi:MAG: hypothetical protein Q7J32_08070 [Sphingomonadaceae bacterium]|nr:hypothetical protein [Sphingomonadaceae bacterium]
MSFRNLLILLVAVGAPVSIASAAPSYVATFATPAATTKLVSSERLWSCDGTTCLAGGDATSPARNICIRIAKEVGAVTGFTASGQAFTAEQVAACNERAGHGRDPAAAK